MRQTGLIFIQGVLFFSSHAFQLNKVDPGIVSVAPGDSVSFLCGVDNHWEFCKFTGPAPNFQECDFEWKRLANGVVKQKCDLSERAEFNGKYNDKECGVTIRNVQPEDSGVWSCHIEEYVFLGNRGSGNQVFGRINLTVQAVTTTKPELSTATVLVLPTTPQQPPSQQPDTTSFKTPVKTTTFKNNEVTSGTSGKDDLDAKPTTFKADVDDSNNNDDILITNQVQSVVNSQENGIDIESENPPEAVPRVEEADSNLSAVIGVVCAVALIGIMGLAAMAFKKRQLSRQRPDAAAAVVYDREARAVNDERNMMGGGNSSVTGSQQLSVGKDTSHYHEFFPPNMSAQNATTTYNSV